MSKDWVQDIKNMHDKFGVKSIIQNMDPKKLKKYLEFRLSCIQEEVTETNDAFFIDKDPEEIVDGLIDTIVFSLGTLELFGIDVYKAWDTVLDPNMNKEPGIKLGRDNPFNLPDLLKPEGWKPPCHKDNCGIINKSLLGD